MHARILYDVIALTSALRTTCTRHLGKWPLYRTENRSGTTVKHVYAIPVSRPRPKIGYACSTRCVAVNYEVPVTLYSVCIWAEKTSLFMNSIFRINSTESTLKSRNPIWNLKSTWNPVDFDILYAEMRRGGPLARDRRFVDAQSAHCDSKLTAAHCVIAAF